MINLSIVTKSKHMGNGPDLQDFHCKSKFYKPLFILFIPDCRQTGCQVKNKFVHLLIYLRFIHRHCIKFFRLLFIQQKIFHRHQHGFI